MIVGESKLDGNDREISKIEMRFRRKERPYVIADQDEVQQPLSEEDEVVLFACWGWQGEHKAK